MMTKAMIIIKLLNNDKIIRTTMIRMRIKIGNQIKI